MQSQQVHSPQMSLLGDTPFWTRICAALVLGFFFAAASSDFFILQIYTHEQQRARVQAKYIAQ